MNLFRRYSYVLRLAVIAACSLVVVGSSVPAAAITGSDFESIHGESTFYDTILGCLRDGGTSNDQDSLPLAGNDNIERAYNYFVGRGFEPFQAAGIVGNLMQESGVNPKSHQGGGGPGRGIAQWSVNDRWANLVRWARDRDPWALSTQLDFIWYEMNRVSPWKSTLPAVKATVDIETKYVGSTLKKGSVEEFEENYEKAGKPNMENRIKYAKQVLARYGSGSTVDDGGDAEAGDICDANTANQDPGNLFGPSANMQCQIGRDGGIQDGYRDGKLTKIRVCIVGGIDVNVKIEKNVADLLKARPMSGGGFRTMAEQRSLRIQHGCPNPSTPSSSCSPPTARPGYSNHQMGLAIDFSLGSGDFAWLKANASKYGLKNLPSESWHWSVDGT
jgi:hypothetical protein